MTHSEQLNDLAAALAKAQGEMTGAAKDTLNPFFSHKYADLASVWDACRKPLAANGLSIIQSPDVTFEGAPEFESYRTRTGEERWRAKVLTTVRVHTRLLHASGQWIDDVLMAVLPSGDPQSIGSAITYLRRYALSAMVGVAPEDDDAESAQSSSPSREPARPVAAPPAGYDKWLAELTAIATTKGLAALQDAWKNASREYTRYLSTTAPATWNDLKLRAASVRAVS